MPEKVENRFNLCCVAANSMFVAKDRIILCTCTCLIAIYLPSLMHIWISCVEMIRVDSNLVRVFNGVSGKWTLH